jgi:hypothetical protein
MELTGDDTFQPKAPQNPSLSMLPTPNKNKKPESVDVLQLVKAQSTKNAFKSGPSTNGLHEASTDFCN